MKKEIIVSGIRPTGKMHLGNYLGAMRVFAELQEKYECFFFAADFHSLTDRKDSKGIKEDLPEIIMDYLASGLDPEKCTIFAQSSVPEIPELALLLSMIQPIGKLLRLGTFKEKAEKIKKQGRSPNAGLLCYPVLMAADILIQKAGWIPVGKDQLPHIELARALARRFNNLYGKTFPMPQVFEKKPIKVPGLDGTEKMGKSEDNAILLTDSPDAIKQKIAIAVTDTDRKRRNDPGNPFVCNLFTMHELVSPKDVVEEVKTGCQAAKIGCLECKKMLSSKIIDLLKPFQEKRKEIAAKPSLVKEVLHQGGLKARKTAKETVNEVREKMGLSSF